MDKINEIKKLVKQISHPSDIKELKEFFDKMFEDPKENQRLKNRINYLRDKVCDLYNEIDVEEIFN